MRLLHTTERKLKQYASNNIPLYAILSHTWGENEITFQDIEAGNAETRVEYEKIRNTCALAAAHGFDHVWIDTCCIDKTSSAELSEAINSMYRWYQESGVCYAYIADFSLVDHQSRVMKADFSRIRWFTRGWTLQELIAPSTVIFLDQEWKEIGTKSSLQQMISDITGIPASILLGGDLECASVAQRMSWASMRTTTRLEDLAYCLMGIFGINMPMLYGEGERAFIRLQEEIMKVSDDYSLFAWESVDGRGGLLATSPAAFIHSGNIIPFNSSSALGGAITVNNKGIHLNLGFIDTEMMPLQGVTLAILPCTKGGEKVAIYLRAMSEAKDYFTRTNSYTLDLLNPEIFGQSKYYEKIICVRQERLTRVNQSSLSKAASYGNEAVVKLLLEKGAEPESEDSDGRTSLLRAAENGHKAVVELLLEKGAKPEPEASDSQTPLSLAAKNGHEAVVQLLLEKGAGDGWTPLLGAVGNGHEAVVKLLLENSAELEPEDGQMLLSQATQNGHEAVLRLLLETAKVEVDLKDDFGQTLLSTAAAKGHEAIVKLHLQKGAELESKNKDGRTPLSWAAENGHEAIVEALLEEGAELEPRDSDHWTPLLQAAAKGHKTVVKLLLQKGAELESKNKDGQTPLSWAAENGHGAVVKLLLEEGANPETKDGDYRTPLSQAAENGHEAIVKLLVEEGTELEPQDRYGRTPLLGAAENGHGAVVKLLLGKGANPESRDVDGWTPLLGAAENGYAAVVRLLHENGASLEARDKYGQTALSRAAENGHETVVKLLLGLGAEPESEERSLTPLPQAIV
jgi:ankyrin repeat protein